jgi:predicted nucleic acid-binding protein
LKIYLDTSALIKLYIIEPGSVLINKIISENASPLPIWDLHIIEFHNALKLKVFRKELNDNEALHLGVLFNGRKKSGIYYSPELDRKEHTELCLKLTDISSGIGCRSLDIMHVAAASLFRVDQFITFDVKQAELGEKAGINTNLLTD